MSANGQSEQRRRRRRDEDPPLRSVGGLVPPQDIYAERAVLSAILVAPEQLDAVRSILPSGEQFCVDANRRIYDAMLALQDKPEKIDLVTVVGELADRGRLEQVGGSRYVAAIHDETPAISNVDEHAKRVREKWRVRRTIAECQRYAAEGYGDVGNEQQWIEEAESKLSEIAQLSINNPVELVGEVLARRVAQLRELREKGIDTIGIATGLTDLDQQTGGLFDGDLYVVAGRPGLGKTSLATTIAAHVTTPDETEGAALPEAALVFSLEMPREQIAVRFACTHGGLPVQKVRQNKMSDEEWAGLLASSTALQKFPLYVDDTPAITLPALRARAKRLAREIVTGTAPVKASRLGLIVVDYMQLMRGERFEGDSREREVASLSAGLKNFAKELSVPIIVMSQLNRSVEQQKDKRPTLATLRESGAIEQDADHVWLLYRDSYYDRESTDPRCELIIAKQRNGPTDTIKLYWDAESTRYRNLAADDYDVTTDDLTEGLM